MSEISDEAREAAQNIDDDIYSACGQRFGTFALAPVIQEAINKAAADARASEQKKFDELLRVAEGLAKAIDGHANQPAENPAWTDSLTESRAAFTVFKTQLNKEQKR